MKKTRILPTVLCLLAFFALSAYAGEHVHNFETVTENATCTESGSTYEICRECGATRDWQTLPALGHNFGEWQVVQAPTCGHAGLKVSKCARCGAANSQAIPQLNAHTWSGWTVQTAPSCGVAGLKVNVCSVCGIKDFESIPALTHSYGPYSVHTAPTCTKPGMETASCANCGAVITRPINALGHQWGAYALDVAPTCTATGLNKSVCSVCMEARYQTVSALGHQWGAPSVVTAPTCETEGVSHVICARCTATVVTTQKPLGHQWGKWKESIPPTCERWGINERQCSLCLKLQPMQVKPLGHAFSKWEDTVKATCQNQGEQRRICATCKIEQTRKTKRAAHTPEGGWYADPKPSLQGPGSKVRYCGVCGKVAVRKSYTIPSYCYNTAAFGYGAPVSVLGVQGFNDNIIPVRRDMDAPMEVAVCTVDGMCVARAVLTVRNDFLSISLTPIDPKTHIIKAEYLFFDDAAAVTPEALGVYAAPAGIAEGRLMQSEVGLLSLRVVLSYDSAFSGHRRCVPGEPYLGGTATCDTVRAQMTELVLAQKR